jgi:hypothetical protein
MSKQTTWVQKEINNEEDDQEEEALQLRLGPAPEAFNESEDEDNNIAPIAMDPFSESSGVQRDTTISQSYEDLCRSHVVRVSFSKHFLVTMSNLLCFFSSTTGTIP